MLAYFRSMDTIFMFFILENGTKLYMSIFTGFLGYIISNTHPNNGRMQYIIQTFYHADGSTQQTESIQPMLVQCPTLNQRWGKVQCLMDTALKISSM